MSDDQAAIEELLKVSKPGARHVFLQYLYFPERSAAEEAAAELQSLGFDTENRLGADGVDWLVLARKELVASEEMIATARQQMEEVTRRLDGEYDGWEAELQAGS